MEDATTVAPAACVRRDGDTDMSSVSSSDAIQARSQGRGLYRDEYEKDSCGFGLLASLDDSASHWLVATAIQALNRLTHRGAVAADGKTGDGCGLMLKKPATFLRAAAADAGMELAANFAAGNVFLSRFDEQARRARATLEAQIRKEGLSVAGWRQLPIGESACGDEALKTLPRIEQVFVNSPQDIDEASFNRKLFLARRRTEKALDADKVFYPPRRRVRRRRDAPRLRAADPEHVRHAHRREVGRAEEDRARAARRGNAANQARKG